MLAPCVGSCAWIIGADDYRVDGRGGHGGTAGTGAAGSASGGAALGDQDAASAAPEVPILPATPDAAREGPCEQCAQDSCGDLWRTCVGDPWCLQMLECKTVCRDPDCLLACTDWLPLSRDFDDYWDCVYGTGTTAACIEPCGTGRNLECAGNYTWRRQAERNGLVELTVGLPWALRLEPIAGVDVRICSGLECRGAEYRAGPQATDPAGEVSLDYTINPTEADVFVEVLGGPERERYLHFDAPYLRDARRAVTYRGRRQAQFDAANNGFNEIVTDETRPVVWVEVRDCLAVPARDMVVMLPEGDEQTRRGIGGIGDFTGELTGINGRAVFLNVPHVDRVTVTAGPVGSTLATMRRQIFLRSDWWAEVKLYPYRRGDPR
jgi:hypothetical protein